MEVAGESSGQKQWETESPGPRGRARVEEAGGAGVERWPCSAVLPCGPLHSRVPRPPPPGLTVWRRAGSCSEACPSPALVCSFVHMQGRVCRCRHGPLGEARGGDLCHCRRVSGPIFVADRRSVGKRASQAAQW